MNSWGPFNDEDEFNLFLRGDGEPLLLNELRTFFGVDFQRVEVGNTFFGRADHYFFHEDQGRLLLVESAEALNKEHLAKDLLYLFEDIPDHDIKTKVLFWILMHRPTADIIENIHAIHDLTLIGTCRPQFHISTIIKLDKSELRLNIESSFGERTISINGLYFLSYCTGLENWFSVKQVAKMFGIPYSSCFNMLKRWDVQISDKGVSKKALNNMILKVEKTASMDLGLDFTGKFIPAYSMTGEMMFAADLNRMIGKKGYSVRVNITPRWITIYGSASQGYRKIYDKNDAIHLTAAIRERQ